MHLTYDFSCPVVGGIIIPNRFSINRDIVASSTLHSHDFIEIEYILMGYGTQTINGKEYFFRSGDLIILNVGDFHEFCFKPDSIIVNLMFAQEMIFAENETQTLPNYVHPQNEEKTIIRNLIFEIENEAHNKRFGYEKIIENNLKNLILYSLRTTDGSEAEITNGENSFIDDIADYIDKNIATVSLPVAAKHFGYNVSYFSRLFRKHLGTSFSEYITVLRLKNAQRMLIETSETIESISHKCGFKNHNIFCKKFREQSGILPSEYRKKW